MSAIKNQEKINEMIEILKTNNEFVVLDIETSQLSPMKGGRIIEIGAVRIRDGKVIGKFSQLINPEQKLYAKTISLTGITNEMIVGKPVYRQVLPEFYKFIGNAVIVAHNAEFDWNRFLLFFFEKVCIFPKNKVVCTLQLSKYLYPNKKKHNLEEVCKELSIKINNHHRALSDAIATAQVLLIYRKKLLGYNTEHKVNQMHLFDMANENQNNSFEDHFNNQKKNFKIKRVKYWCPDEYAKEENIKRRIYVTLNIGTVFFDIPTRTWGNKNIKEEVNLKVLQDSVLKYLKLKTVDELCCFRN